MSLTTRIISFVSIALLVVAALGITAIDFYIIKMLVFLSAVYLFVVAYRTKEYLWLTLFAVSAILFVPVKGIIVFSYFVWRIIDVAVAVVFALFVYRYYDSYRKGSSFEKFVASMLSPTEWAIEDWTKDKSRWLNRHVESDMNPDLTVRNFSTSKRFAIECKFRSRFWRDSDGVTGISWKSYNHDFYRSYGNKENIKVKIAFGVGGNPKNPEKLFIVPIEGLEEYKGKTIPAQYLHNFEKNIKTPLSFE